MDFDGIPGMDPSGLYRSGVSDYREGRYRRAVLKLKKVLKLRPGHEKTIKMLKRVQDKMEEGKK